MKLLTISSLTGEMSTLSGGMVIYSLISDVHEITIQLTSEDIVIIKSGIFVSLTVDNTMLAMRTGTVVDTSNNRQLQITLASHEIPLECQSLNLTLIWCKEFST